MAKAIAMKPTLEPREFPAGTQQGSFRFRVIGPAFESSAVENTDPTVEVEVRIPDTPGDYTAVCETLDAAGNVLVTTSAVVTVAPPAPVTLQVAAGLAARLVEV